MTTPPLARETASGREYYNFQTKEAAPSVTSILKVLSKPDVERWKLRMAADCANESWDEMTSWHPDERKQAMVNAHEIYTKGRADIGTLVHAVCEKIIKGIPVEVPKEAASYIGQFGKFVMDKRPKFLESEFTVWSREFCYAGTADALAVIDGETWLLDWKSSKGAYPEFALQLSALRQADFLIRSDCSEEPMPQIDRMGVVHLRPRSWRLIPVKEELAAECFIAFSAARDLFRWKDEVAGHVLGVVA